MSTKKIKIQNVKTLTKEEQKAIVAGGGCNCNSSDDCNGKSCYANCSGGLGYQGSCTQ